MPCTPAKVAHAAVASAVMTPESTHCIAEIGAGIAWFGRDRCGSGGVALLVYFAKQLLSQTETMSGRFFVGRECVRRWC